MNRTVRNLLAIVLSVLLLVCPALASAQTTGILTISDPVITIGENTIDLSGLALDLGINMSGIGVDISANNIEAMRAFATFNQEDGLLAAISGMKNAFVLTMEDLETIANMFVSELEKRGISLEDVTDAFESAQSFDINDVFSQESIEALTEYVNELMASISSGEVTQTTFTEDNEVEVTAQSVHVVITNEQLAELMKRFIAVLESNEQIAASMAESLGTSDTPMSELMYDQVIDSKVYIDGNIYMTETGNTYARVYLNTGEEYKPELDLDYITSETGSYIYIVLYPEASSEQGIYVSMEANDEIDGVTDYYINIYTVEYDDDGSSEEDYIDLYVSASADENGIIYNVYNVTYSFDEQEADCFIMSRSDEEGCYCYMDTTVSQYGSEQEILITFNGDYTDSGVDGRVSIALSQGDVQVVTIDFNIGVNLVDTELEFDVSGMNLVDILTMDSDMTQTVQSDFYTALSNALSILVSEVPSLAVMLNN